MTLKTKYEKEQYKPGVYYEEGKRVIKLPTGSVTVEEDAHKDAHFRKPETKIETGEV